MEAANRSHPTVSAFNRLSNEEKRALVEQAAQQLKQKQELAKKRKQEVQGGCRLVPLSNSKRNETRRQRNWRSRSTRFS